MNLIGSIISKYQVIKHTAAQIGNSSSTRLFIFGDIIFCRLRYKCTIQEYLKYQFYKYKNNYRKNFLLNSHIKLYKSFIPVLPSSNSKYENYLRYKNNFSREIILLPNCGEEVFCDFIKKHPKFILKPDNCRAGFGVRLFNCIDEIKARDLFNSINVDTLCEEYVNQHKEMVQLNPYSVNTVRIVTICNGNRIEIISAAIKMGKKKDVITDNLHSGGIAAAINIETGIVITPGMDYKDDVYFEHPVTKIQILGFKIPLWEQVKEAAVDTHKKFLEKPIIGLDIAIKESSIEIIEVNVLPGVRLMQLDKLPKGDKIFSLAKLQKNRKSRT